MAPTLAPVGVPGRAELEKTEPKGILGTVRNATLLLELLARGPATFQSVTALAEQSGLSIATAHRVLRSLAQAGLVRQSRRSLGYGLGPGLVRLSERYLRELPVLRALSPYLVELRNLTRATIELSVLVEDEVICIDRVEGIDRLGMFREPHRSRPAAESAAGRVLLDESAASPFLCVVPEGSHEIEVAVAVRSRSGAVVAALSAVTALGEPGDADAVASELSRHLVRAAETAHGAVTDE